MAPPRTGRPFWLRCCEHVHLYECGGLPHPQTVRPFEEELDFVADGGGVVRRLASRLFL
jgi:hypothetical protein